MPGFSQEESPEQQELTLGTLDVEIKIKTQTIKAPLPQVFHTMAFILTYSPFEYKAAELSDGSLDYSQPIELTKAPLPKRMAMKEFAKMGGLLKGIGSTVSLEDVEKVDEFLFGKIAFIENKRYTDVTIELGFYEEKYIIEGYSGFNRKKLKMKPKAYHSNGNLEKEWIEVIEATLSGRSMVFPLPIDEAFTVVDATFDSLQVPIPAVVHQNWNMVISAQFTMNNTQSVKYFLDIPKKFLAHWTGKGRIYVYLAPIPDQSRTRIKCTGLFQTTSKVGQHEEQKNFYSLKEEYISSFYQALNLQVQKRGN